MHNNFYFLRQLTPALERMLKGSRLVDCFTQEKNEVIFHFIQGSTSRFIRAVFHPGISSLSFPESFARAKKNSVDLFAPLAGHSVLAIRQFENERSFLVEFTDRHSLMFRLYGNRGNIILFHKDTAVEIFRKKIKADYELNPTGMDRHIDWSWEAFLEDPDNPKKLYFTFGKVTWLYLDRLGFGTATPEARYTLIQQTRSKLEEGKIYLRLLDGLPLLSMLPVGDPLREYEDPLEAVNDFFIEYSRASAYQNEKSRAISTLNSRIAALKSNVDKLRERLHSLEHEHHYRYWGDLIMANLATIQAGQSRVNLQDFNNPQKIVAIKMNSSISPQRNAEKFYQKAKKQSVEVDHVRRSSLAKHEELKNLTKLLDDVGNAKSLAGLRKITAVLADRKKESSHGSALPFHTFEYKGYTILIGKNARQNDELTLKVAHKEDLWLHAKDVPGSHVVVRRRAGQSFPKDVIERAAQWAAYYSKRKTESLCPVSYTLKKYVRKRKGDPPGAMVVDRETVVMVPPTMPA